MASLPFMKVENIKKSFNGNETLSDVSFNLNKNEILGILGPSGSGKTTLLRIISGLETPEYGRIILNKNVIFDSEKGINLPPEKRNIALVFQDFALWPHLTVKEHLEFVFEARNFPKEIRKNLIEKYLKMFGMEEKINSYPKELSGGEKQRVAIMRALAQEPKVLLLDEPLSNLDSSLKNHLKNEIKKIQKEIKMPIIYVTHNYLDLIDITNEIMIIENGKIAKYKNR